MSPLRDPFTTRVTDHVTDEEYEAVLLPLRAIVAAYERMLSVMEEGGSFHDLAQTTDILNKELPLFKTAMAILTIKSMFDGPVDAADEAVAEARKYLEKLKAGEG
jgi:hypothetical protein